MSACRRPTKRVRPPSRRPRAPSRRPNRNANERQQQALAPSLPSTAPSRPALAAIARPSRSRNRCRPCRSSSSPCRRCPSRCPRPPRAISPSRPCAPRRLGRCSARSRCRRARARRRRSGRRPTLPATMPSPMPGPDPGDVLLGQGRQRNDYLSRVARQIAQYRVYPASALANNQGGRVVMRVTVARTGQVLDVGVRTSSGWPAIDAAEARDHPQGSALSAVAERDARRSGGPGAAHHLQPGRLARALKRQAKSRASA